MAGNIKTPEVKKRALMLYLISGIKIFKGLVLLFTALGIFALAGKDLEELFNQSMRWIHLDPENRFFSSIGDWLDTVTPSNVRVLASGTFLCGLFLLVLGLGLAFRAKWAIWLAIGESAFFIPIEIFELVRRPESPHHHPVGLSIVLAINVIIVWYLYANRNRLFRHHR
ncbi:MAG: DUF2127 domain-containing protein [Verrucomicrobiota bacterium]|jgi:uncharacterized membrane protein (DUF2068 family)